ncbi:MAG: GtrA family protein [Solirubrobacterales bacterium]|nr:GtrA family protein [Solirubrobacterales bacterium]
MSARFRPTPALRQLSNERSIVTQFVKFAIVGVSNTLLTFVVYTVLIEVFDVWYIAASGIGFAVGAVNGFLLNRRWTFRGHAGDRLTAVRWTVVQGSGLLLDEALIYLFVHDASMDKLIAQACAIAVVTVSTFLVNRAWTFPMAPPQLAERSAQDG